MCENHLNKKLSRCLKKLKTIFRDCVIILFTIHAPTREGASRSSVPRDKNEVPAIHQQYYLLRILCKRGEQYGGRLAQPSVLRISTSYCGRIADQVSVQLPWYREVCF